MNESLLKFQSAFKDWAEPISKSVIFLTGFCYIVGMIVVNASLESYGYTSFELFKGDYIRAGVWAVIFASLATGVVYGILHLCGLGKGGSVRGKIVGWTMVVVIIVSLCDIIPEKWLDNEWFLFGWFCTLAALSLFLRHSFRKFLLTPILLFFAVLQFGLSIYGKIPISLFGVGGGELPQVRLIYDSNEQALFQSAGIVSVDSFRNNRGDLAFKSQALNLIAETDQDVTISTVDKLTMQRHTSSIKRDLVQGIIHIVPERSK